MFRPMRPIRPVRAVRPPGAPLVRGLVAGGAAYAAGSDLGAGPDLAARLAGLGQLVQQGLLTPEEFAVAKAKLLAG